MEAHAMETYYSKKLFPSIKENCFQNNETPKIRSRYVYSELNSQKKQLEKNMYIFSVETRMSKLKHWVADNM